MVCKSIFWISHNIAHKIKAGQLKLIAVTRWNHTELASVWNFVPVFKMEVKSLWGEISLWIELVTAYRSFLIDRGNFTPEQTFKCDRSLKGLFLLKKNFSLKNKSLETKRLIQVFLQKLRILNIILYKWKFFCTKELLTKFIFGIPEKVFLLLFLYKH